MLVLVVEGVSVLVDVSGCWLMSVGIGRWYGMLSDSDWC